MSGFCMAILGHLNSSYNVHYRNCCPNPGKATLSVGSVQRFLYWAPFPFIDRGCIEWIDWN